MNRNGEGQQLVYRLLLAVDIQGYSKRDTREQLLAQRQLSEVLDAAARAADLDRAGWDEQAGGDGELATLPAGVDPAPVAGDFAIGLADALRETNRGIGQGDGGFRLRVRLAAHHGTLTPGPFGPAGDAPIVVQRLLDSAPLRRLLVDDAGRDLAYVVSDKLFEDVVQTGFCALPPEAFQAIKVTAKGAVFRGHILTGRAARSVGGGDAAGGDRDRPDGRPAADAQVFDFAALAAR
ncbi:hypothetical protein [Actinomadura rubrisoli]|uniref:hypothetical protein n=1 Tax=Actinomadura rubrisoli TaxID=2530368 RepID=UPI001A9DB077|nr:hypothetical protein [Actinomadura rubrisoli]